MSDETLHFDFAVTVNGDTEMFLGHFDRVFDESENPSRRFLQIQDMLHELAWQVYDRAVAYENFQPRAFKTPLDDVYYEVGPDMFVAGDDYEQAVCYFNEGMQPVSLEKLRAFHPELKEV